MKPSALMVLGLLYIGRKVKGDENGFKLDFAFKNGLLFRLNGQTIVSFFIPMIQL